MKGIIMGSGKWFKMGPGKVKFLIKGLSPYQILLIENRIRAGKLNEEMGLDELFKSVLIGFKGIGGGLLLSRQKKINALCADPEVRSFVLEKGFEILQSETEQRERILKTLDKVKFGLQWRKNLLKKEGYHGGPKC